MLHISIKPEVVFYIAGLPVTNSIFAGWIALVLFFGLALAFYRNPQSKSLYGVAVRTVLKTMYAFFQPVAGRVGDRVYPLIASLFLFILFANWIGLLPGFGSLTIRAPYEAQSVEHTSEKERKVEHAEYVPLLRGATADLNMTLALALVSFSAIQYFGLRELKLDFVKKFINFKSPLKFFLGLLEIVSEISKIISFTFRLFGNMFAGEVLIVVIAFLIPVLASTPFLFLEIFVSVIQALVFALLTAVFINLSTTAHH